MKKTNYFAIYILVISMLVGTPSFSATVGDIAGTWDTYSEAKLKISGVGSFLDENPSTTVLGLDRTFSLSETTSTGPYTYTGAFDLIDEKKTFLSCRYERRK
jgi:hypothetical protein